jgi:glycosyltransferase involved in cell wall biosynthesis
MTDRSLNDDRVGVMQLVDTLDAGGAERVALNLANLVPRDRFRSFLCTTRRDGELAALIDGDVGRLSLGRRRRFDLAALRRLAAFIDSERIGIVHAHGTALFMAGAVSLLRPHLAVVWHDHYGRYGVVNRPVWVYRLLAARCAAVLSVTPELAEWARSELRVPADVVRYVPNFSREMPAGPDHPDLPGSAGTRIVCVANFRRQKDHLTLLRALKHLLPATPEAHLLLVGAAVEPICHEAVVREIRRLGLENCVSLLGLRRDVPEVLRGCDIGVLSSTSEGLPLALIEYGLAGLAVVATGVGQCPEVLRNGEAGLLASPSSPGLLAAALQELLRSPSRRAELASRLRRVQMTYSAEATVGRVWDVYDKALSRTSQGDDVTGPHPSPMLISPAAPLDERGGLP